MKNYKFIIASFVGLFFVAGFVFSLPPVKAQTMASGTADNWTVSGPVIRGVSLSDGYNWAAGKSKVISWSYSGFSSSVKNVSISLCHPTEENCAPWSVAPAKSPATISPSGNGLASRGSASSSRLIGAKLFDRLGNPADPIYPLFANYQARVRICPVDARGVMPLKALCAESPNFTVVPSAPAVYNISFVGDNNWLPAQTKIINWSYGNFGPDIKTVSLSICNPKNKNTCTLFNSSDPKFKVISSGGGVASGNIQFPQVLGPQIYSRLYQQDDPVNAYFDNYQAVLKVCPTTSSGETPAGATCGYGPIFTVSNPSVEEGDDAPAIEGCFAGQCVCVDGKKATCGIPMKPYAGCTGPTPSNCPGVMTASLSGRLMASISSVGEWFSSWFK